MGSMADIFARTGPGHAEDQGERDVIKMLMQKVDNLHAKMDGLTKKVDQLTLHPSKLLIPADHSIPTLVLNSPSPTGIDTDFAPLGPRRVHSEPVRTPVTNFLDVDYLVCERRRLSTGSHCSNESTGSGYVQVSMPGPDVDQHNRQEKTAIEKDTSTTRRLHMLSIGLSTVLLLTFAYHLSKSS